MSKRFMVMTALAAVLAGHHGPTRAAAVGGFTMEVLVDGQPVTEYAARGTRYVEAVKGKEYAIRLHNPLGVRVAVALSVDGLNTIDARRTTAGDARKWVLEPYETVVISGWQVGVSHARRFYFTTEEQSYAQWMGQPENVGGIAAVFFRERAPRPPLPVTAAPRPAAPQLGGAAGAENRADAAASPSNAQAPSAKSEAVRDEYAATGIGRQTEHQVEQVSLDLESSPVASLGVRYEYRAQLVRLGVLPERRPDPLTRRERARGFDAFCPVP